jgi:23S rRNA G2445 N2-methylase RlmL
MSSIARANAERAGVSTATKFVNKPIEELFLKNDQPTRIITNPPYGKRLEESPVAHAKLMELFALDHIK